MMTRRMLTALLAALALDAACAQVPRDYQPAQLKEFPRSTLTIQRADGRDTFHVFIADTPPRQAQGLMWIRDLPADYGMLFLLDAPRPMQMWMKNTYIRLDMVFFGPDGRILNIAADARPLNTDIIDSGGAVAGVLELRGGEAGRRGIKAGDRLLHPALQR
ncbi:MAG: DUF192 domain-containing protein [Steroidobacteraceae bacterium]